MGEMACLGGLESLLSCPEEMRRRDGVACGAGWG